MIDGAPRALRGARCMRGRRRGERRDGRAGAVLREGVDGVCGLARAKDDALRCRPCGLHGPQRCPRGHHRCMADIDVNAVWRDVERKLFR